MTSERKNNMEVIHVRMSRVGFKRVRERLASFRDVTMGERGENKTQHLAWSQTGSAVRPLEMKLL